LKQIRPSHKHQLQITDSI